MVTSRSVPLIRIASSPADSIRILASTGIVFFRSTTPWTKASSFCSAPRAITNCIYLLLEFAFSYITVPLAQRTGRQDHFKTIANQVFTNNSLKKKESYIFEILVLV